MTPPKVSLSQQIEAVRMAETRQRTLAAGGRVQGLRGEAVEQYDLARLNAAARTLEWLEKNREVVLLVQAQIDQAEAIAKAGGPVR